MAFTEEEFDWVQYVSGKKIDAKAHKDAIAKAEARESFLANEMGPQLDDVRDFIRESQDLVLKTTSKGLSQKGVWQEVGKVVNADGKKKMQYEMPWRATDDDLEKAGLGKWAMHVDVEVDTKADIREGVESIPPEQIAKLQQGYERALELQKRMEAQIGADGKPLFTDDDIRREVWTPLVRSGVIPDNIVPDKYSEHAIAFNGAAELYKKKVEDFSAKTTKGRERFKKGMRITKEVAVLAGTLTSSVITAKNANDVSDNNGKITNKLGEKEELQKEIDGLDPNVPSEQKQIEELQKQQETIDARISVLRKENALLANETVYAQTGTTLLMGTLSTIEMVEEHVHSSDDDAVKWSKTIEKALGIAQSISVAAVTAGMVSSQGSDSGNAVNKAKVAYVTGAIKTAFVSAKILPGLVLAMKETNTDKRIALCNKMVAGLADAIAAGINMSAQKALSKSSSSDPDYDQHRNHAAAQQQLAAALKIAITQAGNGAEIVRAIQKGNKGKVAALLGSGAIAAAFGGLSETAYDGLRENMDSDEKADLEYFKQAYTESSSESTRERGQDSGSASTIDSINKALQAMDKTNLANLPDPSPEDLRDLSEEVEANQELLAKEELKKAFSPEGIDKMMEDVDADLSAFNEVYSQAFPDPDIENRTPEEIIQAQAAIDRAMENTAKLRQKVAIINGMTSTGASVLAALVPGTGAVVAAQKLVADIYALKKQIETHNAWVQSMKLAFAAQSAVAPAIQNTLDNAKVHLDHDKIKVVLDGLQVGTEIAKVFDPTGTSAIVGASLTMAGAVVEFGFKMHAERQIDQGWKAYKAAISDENQGNRKAARKALRLNSTLAKCCIAYGASIMGDPSAQQAMRNSGLTVAALKNDKDICVKLVAYLESELNRDVVTLGVIKEKSTKWEPGKPELSLAVWTNFKAAASRSASPKLHTDSTATPAIDRCFSELGKLKKWQDFEKFEKAREAEETLEEEALPDTGALSQELTELKAELEKAADLLERLEQALTGYKPMTDDSLSAKHTEMESAAKTFAVLAKGNAAGLRKNIDLIVKFPYKVAA